MRAAWTLTVVAYRGAGEESGAVRAGSGYDPRSGRRDTAHVPSRAELYRRGAEEGNARGRSPGGRPRRRGKRRQPLGEGGKRSCGV